MLCVDMEHNAGIDVLRGIAAFGIVGCHLLLLPMSNAGRSLTSFCDMNVGVFAALSGYLMATGLKGTWGDYVQKRVSRIVPAYFSWTCIYLLVTAFFQYLGDGAVKPRYVEPIWWVRVFFWGSAATHLWFLASLLYAQILMAALAPRLRKGLWFVLSLPMIALSIWSTNWYVTYPLRLLAFLMLGYGMSGFRKDGIFRHRKVLWSAVGLGLFLHFVHWPFRSGFLKDWVAVIPILLLFASFKGDMTGHWGKLGSILGQTSMGVYLIHPLFTKAFGIGIRRTFAAPYGVVPVVADWLISWVAAFLFAIILLRWKKLSWLIR